MIYGVQQMVTQERTTNMGATVAHRNGNINGIQSLKIPCHPEVEVENYFDTWKDPGTIPNQKEDALASGRNG